MEGTPKQYTNEEIAEMERSRTVSDAELLKNGAEYKVDDRDEKRLEVTDKQIQEIKHKRIDDLDQDIKKIGSFGCGISLDRFYGGGMVSIKIDKELQEKLKNRESALKAYEEAGYDASKLWLGYHPNTYTAPSDNFDVIVLDPGTSHLGSGKLEKEMDKLGYRLPETSERIALAIIKQKFFNGIHVLATCNQQALFWPSNTRFLFVRK